MERRRGRACLKCKAPKGVGFPPEGSKSKNNAGGIKDALGEQLPKKQTAEAKDNPELKEHLEAVLIAVTAKKTNVLPIKDQRAKLLAQTGKNNRNQNGSEDQADSGGCGFPRCLARRI
eukprot:4372700-Amphidinium_carterae.1